MKEVKRVAPFSPQAFCGLQNPMLNRKVMDPYVYQDKLGYSLVPNCSQVPVAYRLISYFCYNSRTLGWGYTLCFHHLHFVSKANGAATIGEICQSP